MAQNSQGNTCAGVSFLRKLQDACKFSKIFKSNFFAGHLQTATSDCSLFHNFQKRKPYFKSNSNCKSKGNVYILKLKFFLKSGSAAYFFLNYPKQSCINFRFHIFPCQFFTLIKNRFHYV